MEIVKLLLRAVADPAYRKVLNPGTNAEWVVSPMLTANNRGNRDIVELLKRVVQARKNREKKGGDIKDSVKFPD